MVRVDTLAQFPYTDLPTEIGFLILTYAARPTFSQTNPRWYGRSYYPSALALCCVSRTIRRIILPELLHTVFLVKANNVLAFVHALHTQTAYAQQKHHLYVDYAAHVRKIWISEALGSPFKYKVPRSDDINFSLLAPVLFAAQSLALDSESLFLLYGCLEYAWNSHVDSNINQEYSPNLPWSTRTLTLLEDSLPLESYPLANTAQERAFLASISHIITLPLMIYNTYRVSELDGEQQLHHILPKWMDSLPWASLKSLRAISVVLPHIPVDAPFHEVAPLHRKDVPVELLTFSAPEDLLSGNWTQKELNGYAGRGEIISSVDVCGGIVSGSDPSLVTLKVFLDWEKAWAHEICRTAYSNLISR
jgi:hypothetical protein